MEHHFSPSVSQFVEARKYLQNVTGKTLIWYTDAFKHFAGCTSQHLIIWLLQLPPMGSV